MLNSRMQGLLAALVATTGACAVSPAILVSPNQAGRLQFTVREPVSVSFLAVLSCGSSPAAEYPLATERDRVWWQIARVEGDHARARSDAQTPPFSFGVAPAGFRQVLQPRALQPDSCYVLWAGDGSRLTSLGFRLTRSGHIEIIPPATLRRQFPITVTHRP